MYTVASSNSVSSSLSLWNSNSIRFEPVLTYVFEFGASWANVGCTIGAPPCASLLCYDTSAHAIMIRDCSAYVFCPTISAVPRVTALPVYCFIVLPLDICWFDFPPIPETCFPHLRTEKRRKIERTRDGTRLENGQPRGSANWLLFILHRNQKKRKGKKKEHGVGKRLVLDIIARISIGGVVHGSAFPHFRERVFFSIQNSERKLTQVWLPIGRL